MKKMLYLMTVLVCITHGSAARAQQGSPQIEQFGPDEPGGSHVLAYHAPDVAYFTNPEFKTEHMALFAHVLVLSDGQRAAIKRSFEEYLDAFALLVETHHPGRLSASPSPLTDAANAHMEAFQRKTVQAYRDAGFDVEDASDIRYHPNISTTTMRVGSEAPRVNVSVSFDFTDDTLSAETRKRLEQVAKTLTSIWQEHMRLLPDLLKETGPAAPDTMSSAERRAGRWRQVQNLRRKFRDYIAARQRIRRTFVSTCIAILADEQVDKWPLLEAALRRDNTIPWGVLTGESIDLNVILAQLDTDCVNSTVKELRELYAIELDSVLVRRNRSIIEDETAIDEALYDGNYDRARRLKREMLDRRLAVCRVNDEYAEQFSRILPAECRSAFIESVRHAMHATIHHNTIFQRAVVEAREIHELPPAVSQAVTELAQQYQAKLDQINRKLIPALREHDIMTGLEWIERAARLGDDALQVPAELAEARMTLLHQFQRRRDLDVRTMRALYAIMPQEHHAALPPLPELDISNPVYAELMEFTQEELEAMYRKFGGRDDQPLR